MVTTLSPSESYSITMRLEIQNKVGMLGKVTTAIGTAGGDIGEIAVSYTHLTLPTIYSV